VSEIPIKKHSIIHRINRKITDFLRDLKEKDILAFEKILDQFIQEYSSV